MTYFDELSRAMKWLGEQDGTYFIGQAVGYSGTAMHSTLKDVPQSRRLELPVAEEMQMGMGTGLALEGWVPISIYPRWNFLLCAVSGLVNHLDKYPLMGGFKPKVIIRTGMGSVLPLDPQDQHKGDFTEAIRAMCRTVEVVRLDRAEDIFPAYQEAFYAKHSTILCEVSDFLNDDFYYNHVKFGELYKV